MVGAIRHTPKIPLPISTFSLYSLGRDVLTAPATRPLDSKHSAKKQFIIIY